MANITPINFVILSVLAVSCMIYVNAEDSHKDGYVFVIVNQLNMRHTTAAQLLALDIADQAKKLSLKYHTHIVEDDWSNIAAWTYFPLLEKIQQLHSENSSWIIILEEWSRVRLENLRRLLSNYKSSEEIFLGNGLHDSTETIIHHFALVDENKPFLFPDPRAGIILSTSLVLSLAKRFSDAYLRPAIDFTIDPQYEFARFVESHGINLTSEENLCIENSESCATIFSPGEMCKDQLITEDIYFAVKTCQRYHLERLPILKQTWLKHVHYGLYSDIEDESLGTISLGINTERGHCGKTLAMIRHAVEIESMLWLAIVDDDTLLSVPRLKSLLSCYDHEDLIALGERYGFHALGPYGYDYITGGGGMIFSRELAEALADPEVCECPSNDTPDDMYLGVCLKRLSVPIIHSRLFHQGRPDDYPEQLLKPEPPVSFHKFWMINPVEAYSQWLDHKQNQTHDEL